MEMEMNGEEKDLLRNLPDIYVNGFCSHFPLHLFCAVSGADSRDGAIIALLRRIHP